MSIEITREVKDITVVVTRNGKEVILQPTISRVTDGGFDGIVNGGTP